MKDRCYNIDNGQYCDWGGKGVVVCDEWRNDFKSFYNWSIINGYNPGLEIDRRDNDGHYEPLNCRFVTQQVNKNNKGIYKTNRRGYSGVIPSQNGEKFKSFKNVKGKQKYFGTFNTAIEAAEAREGV